MNRIYFDNAASTPLDPEVLEQMMPWFCEWTGNPSSTHAHGRHVRNAIEEARRSIAQWLACSPLEIYFTSGGTEADNTAIGSMVKAYGITHLVTTPIEHHAVTHPVEHLEAEGRVRVTWLGVDEKGNIDFDELEAALAAHPGSLVSLMHANNEIGTLYDLERIGTLCRQHGAWFHSDTVQTMGHFALDLSQLPVDFVTASAHKFYGPKGVGFLYVRKGIKLPALIEGGGQERNLRAGTENPPAIVGMAYALDKCYRNLESKNAHLWDLKTYMMARLEAEMPGVAFQGETAPGRSLPTVLNTALPCGDDDCMLLFNLDLMGISASGGSACSSGTLQGSHVLRALGLPEARLKNAVRFSFGVQNTREEVDIVVEKLRQIMQEPVI